MRTKFRKSRSSAGSSKRVGAGRYELTQVKFAVDPDNPDTALDWDWLLARKPRGKSLLQRWSDGVAPHVTAGKLATAQLKTDRKPDPGFNRCLVGQRVDYARVPPDIRAKIETQLGSDTVARTFFDHFDFMHSQPVLENLEAALWARISSDTDRAGFALFQRQVQLWATQKNWPHPDGKVRHVHLQQAFSTERAKPLPQGFRVPADYRAPDADFAGRFSSRVRGEDGITVLWAPPGRGKSTFLSHFTSTLNPEEVVCIRHHYFLSLDDRSEGRFHVQAIARSLEAQLEEAVPDMRFGRRSVGEMIEQAAKHIVSEGKRLIVIIDGLDHVWREGRSHEHTEELFNALIPVVPGVHLVVGTQKIAEAHLPARLLAAAPMPGWVELPLMNRAAAHAWVRSQHKAGRLNLFRWPHQAMVKALAEVSDAFADISVGLPLHLIYSFEAAAGSGDAVTPDMVRMLPACPTGDIRDYYATFLLKLSDRGKAILHVLAGLNFAPPPFALNSCFGVDDQSILGLAEIGHLLDFRETEVRPFHGSLFAFLQDAPDHDALFMANSAPTLDWLEREAPPYWREAWLWITQARRGDVRNLIEEPTRDWALSFVAAGYPIDRMINVLEHAETACHPLVPAHYADPKQYVRAFVYRLEQAVRQLRGSDPAAVLCVIVDAADNAEMAASDRGDGHSFARDLIRLPPIEGVRLVFTSRTHRKAYLKPPPETIEVELRTFTFEETARHLRTRYPEATDTEIAQFGHLSSHNPRVQALALAKDRPLVETLRALPISTSPETATSWPNGWRTIWPTRSQRRSLRLRQTRRRLRRPVRAPSRRSGLIAMS
ncbi:ATP-binding protein [Brevundimonas diminuta]|uniref:ATP-binding protein n=1 Tax=Brevundimonas diminuta TaxID=293 RepID=UPI00069A5795|nr:ATP-binding protein [Brevundimonas diminuta]